MSLGSLISFLLLAISCTGASAGRIVVDRRDDGVHSLAFSRNFHSPRHQNIAELDRARARHLFQVGKGNLERRDGHMVGVTNVGVTYTASVGVGSPPTTYTLIVDTGSSNTWVGANKRYKKTSTSKDTGERVQVGYGSGSFEGEEYTDTVTLSKDLVINGQSIGAAQLSSGFDHGIDGILGIGPVDLTANTLLPSSEEEIPTVTDQLFAQGKINRNMVSVFFQPSTLSNAGGEIIFGGIDRSKTTSSVMSVNVTQTQPSSSYWGVDQSIVYKGQQLLQASGIIDTGTTLILLATDAFSAYQKATGARLDNETGLLTVTEAQFKQLKNLDFKIGGHVYSLTPNAQIWPRALNGEIGGRRGQIYLIVADIGAPSGQGLDFINGFGWLQRFYSVFDTESKQVGFATTPYTNAMTN